MPPVKVKDTGRIERLISLAYLLSTRSEIHIEELQERLGVERRVIEEDINVLMFCGLPPYSPEQLFDIIVEDDFVSMLYNDVFVKPLRLNETELTQSVVALERLLVSDSEQAKLIKETIDIINAGHDVPLKIEDENNEYIELAVMALEKNKPLDIEYLSLNSASITQRTIDVVKIFTTASLSYIFGYCHTAQSVRIFRSDRIIQAQINDKQDVIYKGKHEIDISDTPYVFVNESDDYVDLEVDKEANWILDSYPHEDLDTNKNLYRFNTSSPYFIARLLLSGQPNVKYINSTIDKPLILEAVEKITDRFKL